MFKRVPTDKTQAHDEQAEKIPIEEFQAKKTRAEKPQTEKFGVKKIRAAKSKAVKFRVAKASSAIAATAVLAASVSFAAISYASVSFLTGIPAAYAEPPAMPGSGGSGPGGSDSLNVTHSGATEISSDTTNNAVSYSSTSASQNSLLVTGGTSTLTDPEVTKTGDSDGDDADFYGTNAAVLATAGTLNIKGGGVVTNGAHANGIFANSSGIINVENTKIKTSSNNSGAVMVTGGGTLTANNVTAETDGNSSAPIRSDRGGGTLTANGGSYKSNGIGSPVIYSTADITANNADLTSTSSEGAVVEGMNSITLNNSTLTDTNTTLNGNSETYKNIFLYQSMSGDADEGNASFTAKDSTITTNKGDTIFVTNTTATVNLSGNTIINNDASGAFLRIQSGKWGTSGSNGGDVTLKADGQGMSGETIADSVSTLSMELSNKSSYSGTINGQNTAKSVKLVMDKESILTLTGDTYLTSLDNAADGNSNINLNGHVLYVGGAAITSTDYKDQSAEIAPEIAPESTPSATAAQSETQEPDNKTINIILAVLGVLTIISIICGGALNVYERRKKESGEGEDS